MKQQNKVEKIEELFMNIQNEITIRRDVKERRIAFDIYKIEHNIGNAQTKEMIDIKTKAMVIKR
jgi:hypothetical protein